MCEFAENGVHAYPKNISTKRATRVTSLARFNFWNVLALLGALTKLPLALDRVLTLVLAPRMSYFNDQDMLHVYAFSTEKYILG